MCKSLKQVGNPIIRKKTKRVQNPHSKKVQTIIQHLTKDLRKFNLVGIAANQSGIDAQIFLTEIRRTKIRKNIDYDTLRVFINPKILKKSKSETVLTEGCGSLAHSTLFGPVKRPSIVTVEALDENGEKFRLTAKGLLAKIIQHEYDHLQGVSIIDKFLDTRKVKAREEW